MARISRTTTIGVRVSKAPTLKRTTGRFKQAEKIINVENLEPKIINKSSHKKFVQNIFAIRGRTENVA